LNNCIYIENIEESFDFWHKNSIASYCIIVLITDFSTFMPPFWIDLLNVKVKFIFLVSTLIVFSIPVRFKQRSVRCRLYDSLVRVVWNICNFSVLDRTESDRFPLYCCLKCYGLNESYSNTNVVKSTLSEFKIYKWRDHHGDHLHVQINVLL
jgi:hypothetical protein